MRQIWTNIWDLCLSSSAMVRAMLEQSSINAPSSLAAPRQRRDNRLRHVRRRLSQMVEAQLCPEDTPESSDKFPMRDMPRDIQEIAFAKGIPYIPADRKDRS